jgi:hypothetical protein
VLPGAIGRGGWEPVITSNVVACGNYHRLAFGSSSNAEFFIALSSSVVFFLEL